MVAGPPRQPDRPCAKRREGTVPIRRFLVPRGETTGRDRPYSSFRPIDGGAAAQGQMRGRPIKQKGRRDRAFLQKRAPRGPVLWGCAISARPRRPTKQKRPAPGLPGAGLSACEGERPLLAGGVLLSHGLHRSTIGARGLNFRVRDGTGCASPAMAAGQQGAFSSAGPARPCPQGRTALESESPGPGPRPHALPAPAGGGIE